MKIIEGYGFEDEYQRGIMDEDDYGDDKTEILRKKKSEKFKTGK